MNVRVLAKVTAVLVFAFGAITFASARLNKPNDQPKSFVITYVMTRSEDGGVPDVIGLAVKTVDADGHWKRVTVRRLDNEYHRQVSVRFLDDMASYRLEGDRLDYEDTSTAELERDKTARTADWITRSSLFVGEESMLGLRVFTTRQSLTNGWVEKKYSPLVRSTPLLLREREDNVEYTEQAVSIEFRDVSPDEIKPPNLPVSFELSERLAKAMVSNPENAATAKRLTERREAVAEKLRALGRIE